MHLSYTKTAQTQFTLPGGETERVKTNFLRPADRRVRNHTLTEMLEINALERLGKRVKLHLVY